MEVLRTTDSSNTFAAISRMALSFTENPGQQICQWGMQLGNNGAPGSFVCNNGSSIGADACAAEGGVWFPDLQTREVILGAGILVKF